MTAERQQESGGTYAPLRGLTVVDLTHHVAGPYCTRLMVDFGATVIKVEKPGLGDATRGTDFFPYLNAGKKSVTLDAATTRGKELILRLTESADVVVENFRPGTLARWGLGFESLLEVNPGVVLTSISSFGQDGPYRDLPSSELVLQSLGGFAGCTGYHDREPLGISLPLAQYVGGLTAYVATMASLVGVRKRGVGEWIDVSILEALLSIQDPHFAQYFYSGVKRRRAGRQGAITGPGTGQKMYPKGVRQCRDGYVYVFCVTPSHWSQLADMIGRPELGDDPRFSTADKRIEHAEEVDAALDGWLLNHDAAEVYHEGQRRKLPLGLLASPEAILGSAHLEERGFFRDVKMEENEVLRVPGLPFRPVELGRPSPLSVPPLGAHSEAVFGELLGVSESQLASSTKEGAV